MTQDQTMNNDFIYGIAVSPDLKKDGLLVAAKASGLFRSMDKGKTWNDAFASLKLSAPLAVTSVAVAAAGDITYVFAAADGRILRSLDAGVKWQVADLDAPAPTVTAIVASPEFDRNGTLLAATMQDGIFRSTDRGVTWTGWNFGLFDPNINALAFIDSQTVLCGTQSGIFLSANAGQSWRDLDFPLDSAPVVSLAVSVEKTIYAGTESEGLYESRDEGKTWKRITAGAVEHIQLDTQGNILILKDGELLLSQNKGRTWKAARPGLEPASAISTFTSLGADFAKSRNLLVGLSNGDIVKI